MEKVLIFWTINQNIPVNGTVLVSISCQVDHLKGSMDDLLLHLKQVDGVQRIEHIILRK